MGLKDSSSLPLVHMPENKLSELLALAFIKNACNLNDRVAVAITFPGLRLYKVNFNMFKSDTF